MKVTNVNGELCVANTAVQDGQAVYYNPADEKFYIREITLVDNVATPMWVETDPPEKGRIYNQLDGKYYVTVLVEVEGVPTSALVAVT